VTGVQTCALPIFKTRTYDNEFYAAVTRGRVGSLDSPSGDNGNTEPIEFGKRKKDRRLR